MIEPTSAFPHVANSTPLASLQSERETIHRAQDLFASMLRQAGKEGFASAIPVNDDPLDPQSVRSAWDNWFNEVGLASYSFQAGADNPSVRKNKSAEDLRKDYGDIVVDAYTNGGYANPSNFLQSLSDEQLQTIQQTHHLAEPIDINSLSSEASLNLLLPPPTQIDENGDGLTAIGASFTLKFPNSHTSAKVTQAWERATEGVSQSDRLTYELQMSMPLILANLSIDDRGNVNANQPGDANWVNPIANGTYSYRKAADQWLQYLSDFKDQMVPDQFSRDTSFWAKFRSQLGPTD